ncbi:MAG: helix-hairpin-helix domain-containing protein, partial [Promethearchaeota archaeon]
MTSIMRVANSIGKSTVEKMKAIGIDSIEKLSCCNIEELLVINGIGISSARSYIQLAKNHIESIKARNKIQDIINKRVAVNASKPVNTINIPRKTDKKDNPRIPISSIKKLASTSIEELSKLKGMSASNAQKYIEIANKYLESMRKKEKMVNSRSESFNKILDFVKFDTSSYSKDLKVEIQPRQMKESYLQKPNIDYGSIKKTAPIKDVKPKHTKVISKKKSGLQTFFPTETLQKIRFLHFKIKKLEELLNKKVNFSFSELNNIIDYIKILNVNYKTQSQIKIFKELDITSSFYDPI